MVLYVISLVTFKSNTKVLFPFVSDTSPCPVVTLGLGNLELDWFCCRLTLCGGFNRCGPFRLFQPSAMCVCGSWTAECSRRSWWRRVYSDRRRIYASSEGPYIQHIGLKIDLRRSLYTANRAHSWPQKVLIIYNRKGLIVNLKRSLYTENNANNWPQKVLKHRW